MNDTPDTAPVTPDPADADPAVLSALLARHGWRRHGGALARGYARWTPPPGLAAGPPVSLLVPEDRGFPDATDLLAEALTALARSALPSAREVLTGLAVPSDEIRWERDTAQGAAGEPWHAAEQLRCAARAMLLAGVLAVRERAGYHGARHHGQAAEQLDGVIVGPAGSGGALTAFLPVPAGRAPAAALARALPAVREAIDYQRATGGMEVFDAAVRLGACAELAEALVALVRGAEAARIRLAWSPAQGPPAGLPDAPEQVEFTPGDLVPLRQAAHRYRRDEPSVPVRVTGTVVRLRRDGPGGAGQARLRVLAGADVAQVRVALDEDAYRIAGQAHLVGMPIRLSGRLESRGGFRRITGAADVVPLRLDEAERDRALKSLYENLDFFEDACGGG